MQNTENNRRTVLLVDDEAINRMILDNMLSSIYEVKYAEDGSTALDMMKNAPEAFSLIMLDLIMPEMSGIDVLKEMRADRKLRDIPVVVMTAQSEMEIEALQEGANDFIRKPFANPEVIRTRMSNLIAVAESVKAIRENRYDPITDTLNMRYFLDTLQAEKEVIISSSEEENYAIVYFNMIGFKVFNTMNGIEAGDEFLYKVADTLRETFPDSTISRFSRDHFVILTKGEDLEEKIRKTIDVVDTFGVHSNLHMKAGVRYITKKDRQVSVSSVCDQAKIACDSIRQEAGRSICICDERLNEEIRQRNYIIEHIDEAIENDWIKVYYQPVARSISGNLCGFEALARWIDPQLGFLSPGSFIPALEESHLIWKLDSHIIRKICENYRRCTDQGIPTVPISFNLSRLDFYLCDIKKVIDDAIEEYHVPRNMLNIEITESMFMKDSTRIHQIVDVFHNSGFNVWMDDFGSGYSSLNVLKDYSFDELKIDMVFLSNFTEKSRDILISTVQMAKRIGIQTLAEGVETKEQYEFLRSIGCEKIQGYYFGKPAPYDESIAHCREQGMKIESAAWAEFYDKAGKIDFITDEPLAVMENNGKEVRFLFANESYRDALNVSGMPTLADAEEKLNNPDSVLYSAFATYNTNLLNSGKSESMTFAAGDQYMYLTSRIIAECNGTYMIAANLRGIQSDANNGGMQDGMLRNTMQLYEGLALLDLNEDTLQVIETKSGRASDYQRNPARDLRAYAAEYTAQYIYEDDQDAYLAFCEPDTLEERLMHSPSGYLADYFRTKMPDGSFSWHIHYVLPMTGEEEGKYLLLTKIARFNDTDIRGRLLADYERDYHIRTDDGSEFNSDLLWRNLVEYAPVKYFWKDAERRFVGVSNAFLKYYGMKNADTLIGKTDEEMHWHISDGPFMQDEEVLQRGVNVHDVPGKCIIKGVVHNIMATKMPIYHDGRIVGLFGYFIDLDQEANFLKKDSVVTTVDPVTGLSNTRAMIENMMTYSEELHRNRKDFSIIRINVEGYREFRDEFGKESGNALLSTIASILRTRFGHTAAIGRLMDSQFVAINQYTDIRELRSQVNTIKHDIQAITSAAGHPCTCFPQIEISEASEEKSTDAMVAAMIDAIRHS